MKSPRAVHIRFSQWLEWSGYTHMEAAAELGCCDASVSFLRNGKRSANPPLAVAIEVATADWPEGPIDSREWRSDWHDALVGANIFSLGEARKLDALVAKEMKSNPRSSLLPELRRKTRAIKRRLGAG